MTLAASLLPNPDVAVAAVGLAYNVYVGLFFHDLQIVFPLRCGAHYGSSAGNFIHHICCLFNGSLCPGDVCPSDVCPGDVCPGHVWLGSTFHISHTFCAPHLQVGSRLGAGDGTGAKASALSAISVAPFAWVAAAVPLLNTDCQLWLIQAFSDPGRGPDAQLQATLINMFQV
jgi:hypothetical protein